jgi:hypothetical protein
VASWLLFFTFITWSSARRRRAERGHWGDDLDGCFRLFADRLCWGVLYILILEYDPQAFKFGHLVFHLFHSFDSQACEKVVLPDR